MSTALAARPRTGVRKAAIAIVAMGQERAHPILAGLSESHVREIASEIAAMVTMISLARQFEMQMSLMKNAESNETKASQLLALN